jgi:competence protein ComEA
MAKGASVRPEVRDWLEEIACRAGLSALPKPGVLAAAAVCVVLLAAGAVRWLSGPSGAQPAAAPAAARTASANGPSGAGSVAATESARVTVHVVGAVHSPGVYELRKGSRAADAVEAAGGLLGNAAPAALNLARVVEDGEQVVVPTTDEAAAGGAGAGGVAGGSSGTAGAPPGASGKVNLNTATAAQLDALPGVGPSTAAKIVADREKNGPFRTADDLMRVPGIGAKKFDSLKDLVTVR